MSFIDHASFISPEVLIRAATESWELKGAANLRHEVFVDEQGIFNDNDRDAIDTEALSLVAIATVAAEPAHVVGTVRIHQASPGIWWGSRLAVAPSWRRVGRVGTELIRLAVSTANGLGCDEFHAHVQLQNVPLFARLHWEPVEKVDLHGVAHMHMVASLAHYPAVCDPAAGWSSRVRRAQ